MKTITALVLSFTLFSVNAYADLEVGVRAPVLCLGDSLTEGYDDVVGNLSMGYRDHLQTLLGSTYTFVGSKKDPASATGFSTKNSAWGSNDTADIESRTEFELTKSFQVVPDGSTVILWSGTNDATRTVGAVAGYSRAAAIANIEDTLDVIRTFNTNIRVMVLNLGPNGDSSDNAEMTGFNTALDTMLGTYQSTYPAFDVVRVDLNAMFTNNTWGLCATVASCRYDDNTHLSDTGYQAVALQINACMSSPDTGNCDDLV